METNIKEEIFKALGETSVLFMSKKERGVDIIMPTEELERIGNELAAKIEQEIEQLKEALIWCSGSEDFAEGGKAEKGWKKICQPLLKK